MPTMNQVIRGPRTPQLKGDAVPAMQACPPRRGVRARAAAATRRRSSSALREVARVRLTNGVEATSRAPAEGCNLQERSVAMIRDGRVKDLPDVRYHIIRGTLDIQGVKNRRQRRSKCGAQRAK